MQGFANGAEHLLAEIGRLELRLQRQVLWMRAANLITEDEYRGLYVPDAQVEALLGAKGSLGPAGAGDGALEANRSLTTLIEQVEARNREMAAASREAGVRLPLLELAERFRLDPFEQDVLLLCLAPELDLSYELLYAYVQNDITRKHPTIDLALKLFCPTLEDRLATLHYFSPAAALLRNHLVEIQEDPQDRAASFPAHFLKIDRRMVDFVLGVDSIDARLSSFTRFLAPNRTLGELPLPAGLEEQLRSAARSHSSGRLPADKTCFIFQGPPGVGKREAAAAMCLAIDCRRLLVADLRQALVAETPFSVLLNFLQRESAMQEAGVYLAHAEALLPVDAAGQNGGTAHAESISAHQSTLLHALDTFYGPVFVGSEVDWPLPNGFFEVRSLRFEFPMPAFQVRLQTWRQALAGSYSQTTANGDLSSLADKFRLSQGHIQAAARHAEVLAALRPGQHEVTLNDLHAAARAQSSHALNRLAQKIEPAFSWSDLVLPLQQLQQLQEISTSLKYRHVVFSTWGFERKLALSKGLNVLFSGASGTGKTMAAGILAGDLKLDLYKIDLSSVVSKYIGETEKNLDHVFREANASNAILFFDEADALFGKRSEVKDAHDRYANIEVAYLLQKMEAYDGIVILATNMYKSLDIAFARRMHHTVEFPFPDAAHRERIWQGIFPNQDLLETDVDLHFLAQQFELAGGNIRNIALAAAFMAAEKGEKITMKHLILATARELHKTGKLPSKASFRQYHDLIMVREGVEARSEVIG